MGSFLVEPSAPLFEHDARLGKAWLGGKKVLGALQPAAQAFFRELEAGRDLPAGSRAKRDAARQGMNDVKNARSRKGRANWIGQPAEGEVDPGCHLLVAVFDEWAWTRTRGRGERLG